MLVCLELFPAKKSQKKAKKKKKKRKKKKSYGILRNVPVPVYNNLGYQWASFLIAMITALLAPLP